MSTYRLLVELVLHLGPARDLDDGVDDVRRVRADVQIVPRVRGNAAGVQKGVSVSVSVTVTVTVTVSGWETVGDASDLNRPAAVTPLRPARPQLPSFL